LKGARFGTGYNLCEMNDLSRLYRSLVKNLSTPPHGPFKALVIVMGLEGALTIANRGGECEVPPSVLNQVVSAPSDQTRPSKRLRLGEPSSSSKAHDDSGDE
jgi:hypothetical protein